METREKRSPFASRLGLVILLLVVIWTVTRIFGDILLENGTEAPEWTLASADGSNNETSLKTLSGSVVVLSFWSTTCPPCIKELKDLSDIWPSFKERGVRFVGIASGGERPAQIQAFERQYHLGFPLVMGDSETAEKYKVRALPVLYILDKRGRVFSAFTGYRGKDKLIRSINQALSAAGGE